MSCVTPHLYNSAAMYQHQQNQRLRQNAHLLTRPILLCHRLPAVVSQFGAPPNRPAVDPFQHLADVQPPLHNPAKPLTPFSITDILRDGRKHCVSSSSPPSGIRLKQVRCSVEMGACPLLSPDSIADRQSTLRTPPFGGGGRVVISRPWDMDDDDDDCDDVLNEEEDIEVVDVETTASKTGSNHCHSATSVQSTSGVCPLDALLRMTSQPFDHSSSPGQIFTSYCT